MADTARRRDLHLRTEKAGHFAKMVGSQRNPKLG
jgi:hypothetical protein